MPDWDSAQYLKFGSQRTQPARDLAARLPAENPVEVLDVGCGPGNSTEVLAKRYPDARILGIDSSPEMVAAASHCHPDLEFRLCDARAGTGSAGQAVRCGVFQCLYSVDP